jgi:Family of unknown function (DUF5682)
MELHFLAIRHHGAGSCKRVEKALKTIQPDIILLEGVQEADNLLSYLKKANDFTPPIAQVIYNPKNFQQAVYYPFTSFSPEWKTMLYAIENQVAIAHFDLPQSIRFALELQQKETELAAISEENNAGIPQNSNQKQPAQKQPAQLEPNSDVENSDVENWETKIQPSKIEVEISQDPIGFIARLAGYEDSERWWELTFEQENDDLAVFKSIELIMTALRENYNPIPPLTAAHNTELLREAFMRQELRKAIKEGYKKIAVVCGAWHVPALNLEKFKHKDDSALLKGLPKLKLASTWVPWTYDRISSSSGYGAGIISPAWYEFLYETPKDAAARWLVSVAHCLRKADIETSSAHLIEAVRLATTLSAMRGLALPTLLELNEATISVLLNGDAEKFSLIQKELIIGQKMGKVSQDVPILPLQQDIEAQIKTLKLSKYQQEQGYIKASASNNKGGLDLREPHDRLQSQFLHRLNLLGIYWAKEQANSGKELSTKNEYWFLEWKPEFTLAIIEASIWGNNLEQATALYCQRQTEKSQDLSELSKLLQKAIKANLPQAFQFILLALKNISAVTKEVEKLMQTLPQLISVVRYGDVRKTDTSLVLALLDEFIPRIAAMLPTSCCNINDDVAQSIQKLINSVHKSLLLLSNELLLSIWVEMLDKISKQKLGHPFLKGLTLRLLFDAQYVNIENVAVVMEFSLSLAQEKIYAIGWLEGFLSGSGLLLIHNPNLWNILNNWVSLLPSDDFVTLLPLLRRAFSRFSNPEKQKMLALANPQQQQANTKIQAWHSGRAEHLAKHLAVFFV